MSTLTQEVRVREVFERVAEALADEMASGNPTEARHAVERAFSAMLRSRAVTRWVWLLAHKIQSSQRALEIVK